MRDVQHPAMQPKKQKNKTLLHQHMFGDIATELDIIGVSQQTRGGSKDAEC